MSDASSSFPIPETLEPDLARVRDYWDGLKRAEATMPFWDDVDLARLGDLADRALLIGVFPSPERFRLDSVGKALRASPYALDQGSFLHELELTGPWRDLLAQCKATTASAAQTYWRGENGAARIVLPMWGDGRIGMLLAGVTGV